MLVGFNWEQVKAEACLIAGDLIQKELADQIFKLRLTKLVLGTSSSNPFSRHVALNSLHWKMLHSMFFYLIIIIIRLLKGESIPKFVARNAPDFCTVMVICKGKLCAVKDATESLTSQSSRSSDTGSIPDDSRSEGLQTERIISFSYYTNYFFPWKLVNHGIKL